MNGSSQPTPGDPRRDVEVRHVRSDEHVRVGALIVAAYARVGAFPADYLAFVGDPGRWADRVTATLVAVAREGIAGAVAFTTAGDPEFEGPAVGDCGFRFLAVAPEREGRGVGRALVEACIAAGDDRGCSRMVIHSMFFMQRAHRLYERLGFDRRPDLDVRFPGGLGLGFSLDLRPDAPDRFPPPAPVAGEPPWWEEAFAAWGRRPAADDGV